MPVQAKKPQHLVLGSLDFSCFSHIALLWWSMQDKEYIFSLFVTSWSSHKITKIDWIYILKNHFLILGKPFFIPFLIHFFSFLFFVIFVFGYSFKCFRHNTCASYKTVRHWKWNIGQAYLEASKMVKTSAELQMNVSRERQRGITWGQDQGQQLIVPWLLVVGFFFDYAEDLTAKLSPAIN